DSDHLGTAAEVLLCQCRTGDQSSSTDGAENAVELHLFPLGVELHFAHECRLARYDQGIVERVEKHATLIISDLTCAGVGNFLAITSAVICQHDGRTCATRQLHLSPGSIARHDDRDRYPGETTRERQSLREVSR